MSDYSRGPGWWRASDGRFYPPEQHPEAEHLRRSGWWLASDGRWYPPSPQQVPPQPFAPAQPFASGPPSASGQPFPGQPVPPAPAGWWVGPDGRWHPQTPAVYGLPLEPGPIGSPRPSMPRRIGSGLAVLLVVGGLIAGIYAGTSGNTPSTTHSSTVPLHSTTTLGPVPKGADKPISIPIVDFGRQGVGGGAFATVETGVGNVSGIQALVDTGSTGLRVFEDALQPLDQSGVTLSKSPLTVTFGDGTIETGVKATASFMVGGTQSSGEISFEVVQQASCAPGYPHCPGANGAEALEQEEGAALIGIGLQGSDIPNPLLSLPGPYGKSWSLALKSDMGVLTLGAPPPARPLASFSILDEFSDYPDSGFVNACWTVTGVEPRCLPTLFDSGTSFAVLFNGNLLPGVPSGPTDPGAIGGAKSVASGLNVAAAASIGSKPFWRFTTGQEVAKNEVQQLPSDYDFVNTGVAPFFDFLVTYAPQSGSIWLSGQPSGVAGG
ncbi:MAG TPA: hypothetical protein VGS21_03055 [Acidimicrobiales bacterium]|nr:hypothetical protein [Acidimicrobiales bacterium]